MLPISWIQEIAFDVNLPKLNHDVCSKVSSGVESELKKIIEQSIKYQKRTKKNKLLVEHLNLAITYNKQERIYGLTTASEYIKQAAFPSSDVSVPSTNDTAIVIDKKISLVEYAREKISSNLVYSPHLHTHWLAVNGVQPQIIENPQVVIYDPLMDTSSLPKEIQRYYTHVTTALLCSTSHTHPSTSIESICNSLQNDVGISDVVSYICRFIFIQVRNNTKQVDILHNLMKAVAALVENKNIALTPYLHQLLPSVLTCVVGALNTLRSAGNVLSSQSNALRLPLTIVVLVLDKNLTEMKHAVCNCEDWKLREYCANIICKIVDKYGDEFPDLYSRICKTYMQVIASDPPTDNKVTTSLSMIYGALRGLHMLGNSAIKNVLIHHLSNIEAQFQFHSIGSDVLQANNNMDRELEDEDTMQVDGAHMEQNISSINKECIEVLACRSLLVDIIGSYITRHLKSATILSDKQQVQYSIQTNQKYRQFDDYIDCNCELLTPYYLRTSSKLYYAGTFFI